MKSFFTLIIPILAATIADGQKTVTTTITPVKLDKTVLQRQITKTATGKLVYLPTTQGKDLTITNIGLQGYFYSATSGTLEGGGTTLSSAYLNGQTVLHSGESFDGTITATHGFLYSNASYTYALKVDGDNKIAEADETNNTAEVPVTAHIPSPLPPDPDLKPDLVPSGLEVSYNAQTHMLHISYIVTNIGRGAVDLTKVSAQGFIARPGAAAIGAGGSVVTSILGTMLPPNRNQGGSYNCTMTNLQSGITYRYDLTLSSYYQVPEFNTQNNSVSINFTIP